uniref:Uncharacterized protein n=1 Tax=Trypanosoma congolense (strain IL3000) TaxID=1068625 RepID=G0UR62_TRYCI|nr:hypothetical protein, unlikely [Trypanosoma congolense IL3000]
MVVNVYSTAAVREVSTQHEHEGRHYFRHEMFIKWHLAAAETVCYLFFSSFYLLMNQKRRHRGHIKTKRNKIKKARRRTDPLQSFNPSEKRCQQIAQKKAKSDQKTKKEI